MKVLVVDDEPLVRRSLQKAFVAKGHTVEVASDGLVALKVWPDFKPDIVLLDVLMPGLSGPQVLEKVVRQKGTKVILMSAFTGEYTLETAKGLGAVDFIAKPFGNIFEIVQHVERIWASRST